MWLLTRAFCIQIKSLTLFSSFFQITLFLASSYSTIHLNTTYQLLVHPASPLMSPGITRHSLICGLLAWAVLTKCALPLHWAGLECCSLQTPPRNCACTSNPMRAPLLPQEVWPDLWEQLLF